ncbi:MAG TPA: type II toxin-antitoxin system ParD family antitoxin [Alphaproteobacteria bacterium]|nr:type II toxin-antitoxin system ParD family antitoxin [Alphaproteobacteria bacterium]
MRAAIRALDREEAALDTWLKQRVPEAFADPRPDIPAPEAFKRLRQHHAKQAKARPHGKTI